MDIQYTNWQAVFFDFLVGAMLILVVFRFIHYILPVFLANRKKFRQVISAMPVIETGIWLLFFSWYTFKFAEIMSLYAFIVIGILITLIFWISRYFLKDLIAGMFFRISGRFKDGEVIIHEGHKGVIRKFGLQSLEIESQEGQIIFLPYSKLLETLTIKSESKEQSAAYSFQMDVPRIYSSDETTSKIKAFLILLPWSSVQKTPTVNIREQSDKQFIIDVTAFPIEKNYSKKIEHLVRERFTDNKL